VKARGKAATLSCTFPLPRHFRRDDILAFHRRDAQQVAERVDDGTLQKGITWAGAPACLTVRFRARRAEAELAIDGASADRAAEALERMARRMLGLTQRIGNFERRHRGHPQIGRLIAGNPGLRVPLAATPFEALAWAVTGQQISVAAAVSVRRRLIQAAGLRHSGGLWCFPDARRLARLGEADLREAGFSRAKAQTLCALSRHVARGRLPLDAWADAPPVEEIRARLSQIRGIGPWTIDYALLRGFGWLDGSLHGDVAVRRGLQTLLDSPDSIGAADAQRWLAAFSPWRALVAAHLWAMQT
jgi:DNA-3-methyladenine glycosylase II